MTGDHPLASLRAILATDFSRDLPPRVHPVAPWCPEPQFFPGGSGMPTQTSWAEVVPGGCGAMERPPPVGGRDVMVLGNFQATLASYAEVAAGSASQFATTWRGLRQLLEGVPPQRTFLTNVHVGLPDMRSNTAKFPTSASFLERCRRLLHVEIELIRPRTIVCLGVPSAQMLAAVVHGLGDWAPWPGFEEMTRSGRATQPCALGDLELTAVAVRHPSAVVSRDDRRREASSIATAVEAAALARR